MNHTTSRKLKSRQKKLARLKSRKAIFESLEDRALLAVLYVDNPGDYSITTDQGTPGLDNGDTVTWDPGAGSSHGAAVAGLTYGTNAFGTIGTAVAASTVGGVINVAGGTFNEGNNIGAGLTGLTLHGNQFGVDARSGRAGANETIVSNAGGSFGIYANNVTVDGFVLQDQTNGNAGPGFGYAVYLAPGAGGRQLLNNIIQNNIVGVALSNNGAAQGVIQHNLFRNNTQPGPAGGHSIYADNFSAGGVISNVLIDANKFTNTSTVVNSWAIGMNDTAVAPFTGFTVTNNEIENHGRGAYFYNTDNSTFANNSISGVTNYPLGFFDGNDNWQVNNNLFAGSGNQGIWFGADFGNPNSNITIAYSSLTGITNNSINVDPGSYTGTLNASKNWWGAISGPTTAANPGGLGGTIPAAGISFAPWLIYGTDANPAAAGFQLPAVVSVTSGGDVSAADNDFRRLQNAIGAAAAGQTIDIHGAFNWNSANASASYTASISDSATADIRGVEIPAGVNNLTITSSTNDAHIIGKGDFSADYDGALFADDGPSSGNTNLIIEKLDIDDLESAVMFGWNNTGVFNGLKVRNNHIEVAGDDSDTQNIAIYLWIGTNEQITGNTITFQGDGTRVVGSGARSFGYQSGTTGGTGYDGLLIDNNTFQLANTSTGIENDYGIWENGHNDDNNSDIAITNNQFLGRTGIDLFDRALVLSSQTTGLIVGGNTFTDVDNVLYMSDNAGPSPGDTFSFTNNVLTRVGGADGIFLSNTTSGPVQIITNWNTNNTIDGFTGVRGLNELSVQATGSSRPVGAASVLGDVNGVGPRTAVFVDDNWGSPGRFTDPDGIGAGLGPIAYGFNTYTSIATAIAAVQAGGDVHIRSGSYTENLDTSSTNVIVLPGASPGQVTINGNMVLDSNDSLTLELDGTNPATQFDNFIVNGDVTLGGATLNLIINQNPAGGSFKIIDNTGPNPVSGIFAGHADDSTFFVSGIPVTIDYTGGNGNDVVLFIGSPALVYVNDNWVITTDVGPAGLSTGDTVTNTGAGDDSTVIATYGDNAFTTVQQGVAAVAAAGTVRVLNNAGGSYNEDVTINKVLVFNGQTVFLGAANKFILVAGESVAGSTGIVAPTVDVNAGAKINDGILLAASGGTVNVSAGTFAENVVLNKSLTLKGAQFGVDARGRVVGAPNPAVETVVAPTTGAGRPLELQDPADNATIDGFAFVGSINGATGVIESTTGATDNLKLLNNYVAVGAGFSSSALFLNKSAIDASIDKNVFLASATSSQSVFFDGPDSFHGIHFTNNNVLRSGGVSGTGLFVDGNHNVSNIGSVGTPLFKGNLFQGFATGVNIGSRSFDNGEISENTFTGNTSNGLQGGPQHTQILRNTFNNTGTGIALTSFGNTGADRGAQNSVISQNFFSANATEDIFFSATQGVGTIATNSAFGNSFGSNTAVTYNGIETIQASGNWWGNITGPTVSTNPGGTGKIIGGTGAANVDFSPWLDLGTDTSGTAGFQGDFSALHVEDTSAHSNFMSSGGATTRIQEAVNMLANGSLVGANRTIGVDSGTYNELVQVTKSVRLLGAQAGVDARTRGVVPESIVSNGDGDFQVLADNVTIDGFTLQGVVNDPSMAPFTGLGAAIWTNPGFSGTQGGHQIRNNIIQGNISGIELANTGVIQTVVEKNLIQNNNAPGAGSGVGIRGDFSLDNALIDNNTFINHTDRGILIFGATNTTFSNNSINGRGIGVGGGSTLTFTSNTINGGGATGISLTSVTGTVNITGNNISGKTTTGIRAIGSGSGTVTLDNNITTGNADAIDIENYTTVSLINHVSSGNTTGGILANITNVNFTTTNASETVDVDGMAHTIDDAVIQPITYSNVTNLNVFTLGGDDTISVIAPVSGDTIISVDGGPHSLGDTLVYDSTGAAFTVNPASITSATRQTVNYVNIENLFISSVIVAGTVGDDVLTLSFVTNSPYTIQYVLNGGAPVVLIGVSSFVFNAGLGDDTMIVDLASGDAIPPSGVFYNGEGQTGGPPYPLGDVLQVKLGGKNATYTPGSTTGNVTVNVPTDGLITATGLEPVDLTGGGTVTVVGIPVTGANDLWTVANGFDSATGATPAIVVTGTSGGTPIESVHLWNNTNVVLDTTTVAGTDTITVASANNAHGNTNLTIKTGAQAGDVVNVNGVTTVAGTFSVDTSGGTANLNAAINAATITGNVPVVNVDDAPSGQIQDGVDLAVAGGTVNVLAGNYKENVTIAKALSVLGPNVGIAGYGVRNPEAFVVTNGNQNAVFTTAASGITIRGLTIDGNDPLVAGTAMTSGADANVFYGVRRNSGDGLSVRDNIIENAFIGVRGDGFSTGNLIDSNWLHDIGVFDFGYGVSMRVNWYADVTNNKMTKVHSGIHTTNHSAAGPASWNVSGNDIHAYAAGIWHNLQQLAATPMTINNNTISAEVGAVANSIGILLTTILDGVAVPITNTSISGTDYGLIVWFAPTTSTITLGSTDSITGTKTGVYETNNLTFNPVTLTVFGISPAASNLILNGTSITGTVTTGVRIESVAGGPATTVDLQGTNQISGGVTGLRVDGALASLVGSTLGTTSFSGQTGDYVTLANSAMDNLIIGGQATMFNGSLASALTVPQNYSLEDKITHAIDNSTLGFVRVYNGHVFVTPNSFTSLSSPATTTPDVQRAVDNAVVNDIVHVNSGLYPNPVSVDKNLTIDGEVDGSGDPNSIIAPAAGNALTIISPVTAMTLSDLALVAPAGGQALLANLVSPGTTLNLTNLNSSGAAGGSVSNWNTINFTTNDNANTVYVTGVASSGLSTSPLVGKAAQNIEVNGKLIPLGWATTANGTLNVDAKNGDDTVSASPSTTSFINLVGGPHTAGDKVIVDMSGTTPIVIIDGAGGNADSASTKTLHWSQFEQLCVYDPVLTNVVLGDFYLRGTDQADYIQFVSAAQVNPTFRVRVGNVYYPTNGGQYGPYTTSGPSASKLFVFGRGGNDTITMYNTRVDAAFFGEAGDDVITGGYGNDLLVGGQGGDRINGASVGGNDEVWGDDFNPALDTPSVASQTQSGGNDQINTFGGNDTVYGQAGADIINTGAGADYVSGGAGGDQIDGQAGNDRLYGGDGDDVISGSEDNDVVAGNDGNDTLFGRTGNDILVGGLGVDIVNGNEGSDALVGDESSYTGQTSKSLSKNDAADAALLALMALWGPSPVLGDLAGFDSAGPDGSVDTLWGGADADAFFGAPPDIAADRNAFGYGPDLN